MNDGIRDFRTADAAIEHARFVAATLACERAKRAGCEYPALDVDVEDRRIRDVGGGEIFVEAVVTATASDPG